MEQLLAYLHSIHPLSDSLRMHLREIVIFKELKKRQFLLHAGQTNREIFFIQKGLLRCYYLKGEKEVSSWFMKEGDVIVSIESFYDQKQSYESIQALEDTAVFYISYQELENIYRQYPEFNVTARILVTNYLKLWARQLYSIRMQTAKERYIFLLENYPELLQRVPTKYLASYLDINSYTLIKINAKRK